MKSLKEERLYKTNTMKDGYICTVVEYNGANDITVQYEDGKKISNRLYRDFENGSIRKYNYEENNDSRIGETRMMNCGVNATIIEYRNYNDIDIMFEDGSYAYHRNYGKFKDGGIQSKNADYIHLQDLTGKRFGRWTVLYKDEERSLKSKKENKTTIIFWICKCDCGNIKSVQGGNLKRGASRSCGCLESELTIQRNKDTKCLYGKLKDEQPNLMQYLVNKNDGELTLGCRQKILCKCSKCESIRKIPVYYLSLNGFNCPNCSSKISYPNRFVYKLLNQLNIEFETEMIFDWGINKRYDFYIPSHNCIIEAHGMQHYKDCSWSKVEEQHNNDILKENIAKENNIEHYIQLDCRFSNIKHIKNSIYNSEICSMFDLSKIDWDKIDRELKEV